MIQILRQPHWSTAVLHNLRFLASSPFLNIRCDQRGPSELVEGNIYQNLPEPALSTDLSSSDARPVIQAVSQFREISERAIERGILRDATQVHQQNSWIHGTLPSGELT